MKNISLIIFTLFLCSLQAFAEENVTPEKVEQAEETAKDTENSEEKAEEEKVFITEKLADIDKKNIRIYKFNPIKNPKGFITIVEFNDLNCDECILKSKEFYSAINVEDLKNIKFIYKHINNDKTKLVNQKTIYGMVANNFGKFWEYKNEILDGKNHSNEDIINSMMSLGIKKDQLYNTLMFESDRFYKNLDADNQFAQSIKSHTSPMFFIDGYRVNEDISLQEINEYIQLETQKFMAAKAKEDNKYKMGKF